MMRISDILVENTAEKMMPNPFPGSKIKHLLYHASPNSGITKFRRDFNGVWFSDLPTWGSRLFGGNAHATYACYVDVKNPYHPTEDEVDEYYGEMKKIPAFFKSLSDQGFDAYLQGGESGSIAVFPNVKIADAKTGKLL